MELPGWLLSTGNICREDDHVLRERSGLCMTDWPRCPRMIILQLDTLGKRGSSNPVAMLGLVCHIETTTPIGCGQASTVGHLFETELQRPALSAFYLEAAWSHGILLEL